jgi:hypothetical protein
MHGFDVGDLERRLVRAEISAAAIPWADRKVARHRASLRVQVSLCDLIRQRLQAMGIDPKCAIALRLGERAAAELAGNNSGKTARATLSERRIRQFRRSAGRRAPQSHRRG